MKICRKGLHQYDDAVRQCPECSRVAITAWKSANSERVRDMNATWRHTNSERNRAVSAAWRRANPEKHRTACAIWYRANPDRVFALSVRSRTSRDARMSAAYVEPVTRADLSALLRFQERRCVYCAAGLRSRANSPGEQKHLDHVTPLCRDGLHEISNLAWACKSCNESKGRKTTIEFRAWQEEVR